MPGSILAKSVPSLQSTQYGASSITDDSFDKVWRWVHFTTESGLPSNDVLDIFESADHTVWASTSLGTAWYDGFQWITIFPQPCILTGNYLNGILLRAGTEGESLYYCSKQSVELLQTNIQAAVPLSGDSVLVLKRGKLLCLRYNPAHTITPFPAPPTNNFSYLIKTKNNTVWISNSTSLYRWDGNAWKFFSTSSMPIGAHGMGMGKTFEQNSNGTGIYFSLFDNPERGLWEWNTFSPPKRIVTEKPEPALSLDINSNDDAIVIYRTDNIRLRTHFVWSTLSLNFIGVNNLHMGLFLANGDIVCF